jgi:valyl-tRNA synthetase
VSIIQGVIKVVRNIKAEMNIPLTREVDLHIRVMDNKKENILKENLPYIKNLAHVNQILLGDTIEKPEYSATGVLEDMEIFVPLQNVIDIEAEVQRLEQKLSKIEKELTLINKKLNNTDFIEKAPKEIINKEKEKREELADIRDRISGNLKTIK